MSEIVKQEPKPVPAATINGVPSAYVKSMSKYLQGKGWENINDDQAWLFYVTCYGARLNPFNNDCYAVFNRNKQGGYTLSIRTSYEVYITRAQEYKNGKYYEKHSCKFYSLGKDVTYTPWFKLTQEQKDDLSCEVTFYNCNDKVMRKQEPIHIMEYKPIYKDKDGNVKHDNFWDTHGTLMLEKCCVVRGLRLICGKAISGLGYIREEMQNTGVDYQESIKQQPKQIAEQPQEQVKATAKEVLAKLEKE